ncbi:MAG: histidine ammonia-lyase [Elusimicrobia bacterium GWA2_69_24]|nr:MAG: histidine ammonia-lyase [Elusimicrobia bacterium GWA2_69_24]HBL16473.1 histidine ammonia-lyase [Elusimicrobiota bacterium]
MSEKREVVAGGSDWRIEDVLSLAGKRTRVKLSADSGFRSRVEKGAGFVEDLWRRDETIYGVNTGYGFSVDRKIPPALVEELPRQLTRYHRCGLGRIFDETQTRAILAARLASLVRGYSGVRWVLLERLAEFINRGILPLIPEEGSVGASGDLTPLAYVAGALIGEGDVLHEGRRRPAAEVHQSAGWTPLRLAPKEGLALMNGTAVMTALACLAFDRASYLARLSARITSLSVLALKGNPEHFDPRIFELKNHPGQAQIAGWIRADLEPVRGKKGAPYGLRLQDSYVLRCAPHIIGVLADSLPWMRRWIETELNSVNDNPIVDGEARAILHGGNFYGGHIAFVMDAMKTAVANLADLLDRQLALLVDPRTSHGLPPNVSGAAAERAPINHGFKALQIGTSAWAAEALKLTMPASVFSRSTESHNQDKVSMGTIAARDCLRVLELTEQTAAAALMGALQGVELRTRGKELPPSLLTPGSRDLLAAVRGRVAFLDEDRPLEEDLRWLLDQIRCKSWKLYAEKP